MRFVILTTSVGHKPARAPQLRAHKRYLSELAGRGALLLGGPFDDQRGAMIVVRARSMEEAIEIARADPLVEAGLDRYTVRGWREVFDPDARLGPDALETPSTSEASGPLLAPPSEEGFRIVDATNDPAHADEMVRCFAKSQIPLDEGNRVAYLSLAKGAGLKKLLLLHEDQLAGQIEFSPPDVSGLPIEGTGITVIHCVWVLDAFTGLDGSRRLLAACAEADEKTQGLATIAYNSTLSCLPRSFFERHGFAAIDQLDTGRFCGDTPIAAYLMWRPFREEARPPTWDRARMLGGVDFCSAYPWMFGRRLYWGRDYPYRARLAKEGLRRPELLEELPLLATRKQAPWTLVELGIPAGDLNRAVERIQKALIAEPTYCAHVYAVGERDELIVVYPFREYRVRKEASSWSDAIRYGIDKGIPREELFFASEPLINDE